MAKLIKDGAAQEHEWKQHLKDLQKIVESEEHPLRKAKLKAEMVKIFKSFDYWRQRYGN